MTSSIGAFQDIYVYGGDDGASDSDDAGPPLSQSAYSHRTSVQRDPGPCTVCHELIATPVEEIRCVSPGCPLVCHMRCLAIRFLAEEGKHDALIPTHGTCPSCRTEVTWCGCQSPRSNIND